MKVLNSIALTLVIIGGLNWLLVGAFDFDLVATLFGAGSALSRIVYCLVGIAALYSLTFYRYFTTITTTNRVDYNKTASNSI